MVFQVPAEVSPQRIRVEWLMVKPGTRIQMPKPENPIQTEGLPIFLMGDESMRRLRATDQVHSAPIIMTLVGKDATIRTETRQRVVSIRSEFKQLAIGRVLTRLEFALGDVKSSTEAWIEPGKTYGVIVPAEGGRVPVLFRTTLVSD